MMLWSLFRNLVLEQIIPGLPTQSVSNDELEDIKREVGDDAEEPYGSCPSPPNAFNPSKAPAWIHGYACGNLC